MKKLMMMALMAVAATSAFGQDLLVKEAKKLSSKGDYDGAVKLLAPALTSSETTNKAAAWNVQSSIHYDNYMHFQTLEAQNQVSARKDPYDTLAMHRAAVAAWEAALKCDEFDQLPDAKGKVKLKYRTASQGRFKNFGVSLVQAGQFVYQKHYDKEALNAWELYVNMKNTPIFAEVKDFPRDPFFADICYYAAYLAYQQKDFAKAEKYAKLTIEVDPTKTSDATEILLFSKKDKMSNAQDSLDYVNMVKELHKANPQESRYFNLLMEYYTRANNPEALNAWVLEEVNVNPDNKMTWALKGEAEMNAEKWNESIESFKKALEIDPDFIQCAFNVGRCYYAKAMELQNSLSDKNGMITNANRAKVVEVLDEAEKYYVRTRELDPDRATCNWAYPLYQIYYFKQNKEMMKELEAIDSSLAQ